MEKCSILFASHPDYSGNAKAIYEYMKSRYGQYDLSWVVYDEKNFDLLNSHGIKCYKFMSEEFNKKFKSIDIVFFTHDELLDLKRSNQKYIYLGHGNSAKKIGRLLDEDNLAPQDKDYLEMIKNNVDYIICSSELWKYLYHVSLDIDSNNILPLGTARTDYIYNENSKENLKKCGIDISSYKKVLMYLPTFRNGLGRKDDGVDSKEILNLESYDEKELEDYLVSNNYLLIIKYHPYELNKKNVTNLKNMVVLDDNVMSENMVTLTEVIGTMDLIVADYSSAFSDFVILNKPVCFLNRDIEVYRKNRGIIFDNIDFWSPGPYIKNINEFKTEINKLISDNDYYKKERLEYVKMNFGSNTRNCAKNVTDYLFKKKNIFKKMNNVSESKRLYNENLQLKEQLSELEKTNSNLLEENNRINTELNLMKSSRGWELLEKLRRIKYRNIGR